MLEKKVVDPSNFVIQKEIGRGSFGVVYLVNPKDDETKKIAMKVINEYYSIQILREILIMNGIDHPNLLKFIGFTIPAKDDLSFRIFTPYMANKTLGDWMKIHNKNEELDPKIISKIVYGIASAMKYLHEKNIVHQDLKPDNIFMDDDFNPIIADFGLSRYYTKEMEMTTDIGTPKFMAPEMFDDDDNDVEITNKIDVYSFALVVLFLFTPEFKYDGKEPKTCFQLVNYIKSGKRFKIPSNVPELYRSLIIRCWSVLPEERPSFDEIVDELEKNDEFIEKVDDDNDNDYDYDLLETKEFDFS